MLHVCHIFNCGKNVPRALYVAFGFFFFVVVVLKFVVDRKSVYLYKSPFS